MEGPLKQGTVSSQPTPLSTLGATEKLVGHLSLSQNTNRILSVSLLSLHFHVRGERFHEANSSCECLSMTRSEDVHGPRAPEQHAGVNVSELICCRWATGLPPLIPTACPVPGHVLIGRITSPTLYSLVTMNRNMLNFSKGDFFFLTSKFRAWRWVKCHPPSLVSASSCLRATARTQVLHPWARAPQTPWRGGRKAACPGPAPACPVGRNPPHCPPRPAATHQVPHSRFSRGFLCLQVPRTHQRGPLHSQLEIANPNSR